MTVLERVLLGSGGVIGLWWGLLLPSWRYWRDDLRWRHRRRASVAVDADRPDG